MKTKIQLLALTFILSITLFAQNPDLVVTSRDNNSVKVFDGNTGEYKGNLVNPNAGGLNAPQEVLFHSDGSLLVTGRFNTAVLRYDGMTGQYLGPFTTGYSLDNPTKTQIGPDGLMYISSWGQVNNKITRFNAETGEFIDEFTSVGVPTGCGQAWDKQGNLYVARWGNGQNGDVWKFDQDGNFVEIFISSAILQGPTNIWYHEDDHFWVADWSVGEVLRFDTTGSFVNKPITGMLTVEGFDFDSEGNIYLGDWNGNAIFKYSPATQTTELFANGGGLDAPNSVVFRPTINTNTDDFSKNDIQINVFPNPFESEFNFEFENAETGEFELNISDASGKVFQSIQIINFKHKIDLENAPPGTYFLELKREGKVVKSHKVFKR